MIKTLLSPDVIHIEPGCANWREAVQKGCQPLIDNGAVEPAYVDAIYRTHEEIGPYYVVGPGIAMPHARPEDGVNRLAVSLTVFQEGVCFHSPENDPVKLLVTLAATDSESHIGVISELANLFMNEQDIQAICSADSIDEIISVIGTYE